MTFDEYFLKLADVVAEKSSCTRRHYGSVLVRDNRIISTGYNGTPTGWANCNEGGCKRCNSDAKPGEGYDYCVCVHSETNAVLAAARFGVAVDKSTLYTQDLPCDMCIKELVACGISKVVYHGGSQWIN